MGVIKWVPVPPPQKKGWDHCTRKLTRFYLAPPLPNRSLNILRIFDPFAWLGILSSVLAVTATLVLLAYAEGNLDIRVKFSSPLAPSPPKKIGSLFKKFKHFLREVKKLREK